MVQFSKAGLFCPASPNLRSTSTALRAGPFPTTYMTNEGKALKEAYQWEAKWQCPTYEAWVDMRDLGAMIAHGEPLPHPPGNKLQ